MGIIPTAASQFGEKVSEMRLADSRGVGPSRAFRDRLHESGAHSLVLAAGLPPKDIVTRRFGLKTLLVAH